MSSLGVPFTDDALEARVQAGIAEIERQLAIAVDSPEAFVAEAAAHLLNAGGKRFRPLLVMLAAEFGDQAHADVPRAAVVVELTHLATLYHDDVMDEASMRRGAPSANSRWGNSVAILVGDYLFAQASDLVSDLGPESVRIQARTFSRLVQGQIRETLGPGEGDDQLEHYLSVVADKTGSLIATAARLGAKMAGAPLDVQDTLTEFGERVGAAFQLSDDIIDIASETDDSGKTPGTDLREGVRHCRRCWRCARRCRESAAAVAAGQAADRRCRARRGHHVAARAPGDGRGAGLRTRGDRRRSGPAGQAAGERGSRGPPSALPTVATRLG